MKNASRKDTNWMFKKKFTNAYIAKKKKRELNPRTGKNVNRQQYVVFLGRISRLKQKQRTYFVTSVDIYTMETFVQVFTITVNSIIIFDVKSTISIVTYLSNTFLSCLLFYL